MLRLSNERANLLCESEPCLLDIWFLLQYFFQIVHDLFPFAHR